MDNFCFIDSPMLEPTKYASNLNLKTSSKLSLDECIDVIINPYESSDLNVISEKDWNCKYPENTNIHYEDKSVIYLGYWYNVWGHLLTDSLQKFWFILSDVHDNQIYDLDLTYCLEGRDIPDQFKELLNRLGIDSNKIRKIVKPTKFKKIYQPNNCIFFREDKIISKFDLNRKIGALYYTNEYKLLIEKICDNIPSGSIDKVYFAPDINNNLYCAKQFESIFKKNGYKVYHPSKMPLVDQISILKGCKSFCTIEGSISHNALFLNKGAEIILIRKVARINSYQFMINHLKSLDVIYIDSHLSLFCDKSIPYAGPFFLYTSMNIVNYFKTLGREMKVNFSLSSFIRYTLKSLYIQSYRSEYISEVYFKEDIYYYKLLSSNISGFVNKVVFKIWG